MDKKLKIDMTAIDLDSGDSKNISITIANPNTSTTTQQLQNFCTAYGNAYGFNVTLKKAKYVDTSDTVIYPATN